MADQTTNYEFNLPEVDGSEDQWGDLLNQNWSNLDALLLTRDQGFATLEGRTLTAGDGLSGGGNLTQDRTLSVDSSVVRTSRSVTAGNGLSGGGELSADLTVTMGTPGTLDGGTTNNVTEDSHTHEITSTASRTDPSTTTLLQAAGMDDHRTSGDHDARYAQLEGGAAADFTSMPQVGGDPVVESGSNSDGHWTRWADGTQAVHRTISMQGTGAGERTVTWTYPLGFSGPEGTIQPTTNSRQFPDVVGYFGLASVSATSCQVIYGVEHAGAGNLSVSATAIGRWK